MPKYGIEITDETGKTIDIALKHLMVLDKIKLPYGVNGSRTFNVKVTNFVININDGIYFNPNGLWPELKLDNNALSWKWVPCKGIMSENITVSIWVAV